MSADAQCPWPGLIPYEEKDRGFFSGRDSEITALIGVIRRAPLSVLFGQSGLGKTSLIQAGLFPKLRQDSRFPVRIRLSFDRDAPPLTEQVLKKIKEAAEDTRQLYPDQPELHVTPPPFEGPNTSPRTLWEYFHQREGYFWDARNHLVTPVIVLDQFEEWFTQGPNLPKAQREAFLSEIHQLLDNDPPAKLDSTKGWNLERVPLAVVLSLREDYLAHLGDLRESFPGLRESNLRLVPFSETQAREVIQKPAPWSKDPAFTAAVLDSLRQATREPAAIAVPIEAGTDYDPAILSLLLSRLFGSLRQAETGEARARIVRQKGQDVLLDFYRETLARAGANNRERGFLEEKLVTHSGLRNSVALEDAEKRYHARRPVLDRLREARLLHFDDRALGHQRVELAHDVLCGVVLRARDARRAALRRNLVIITGVALIIMGLAGYVAWKEANARKARDAEVIREFEARNVKLRQERDARDAVLEQVDIADRGIEKGELEEARSALKRARELADGSASLLDSSDHSYLLSAIARSAHSLGLRYVREGKTTKALDAFQESLKAAGEIAALNPNDDKVQASFALEHYWVGDQRVLVGDRAGADQAFRTANEILQRLATKDPGNTDWQRELSISHNRLGGMLEEQGDLSGALEAFRISNEIFQKLVTSDPRNTTSQRDLAVSHARIGTALYMQGDLTGALQAFRINNEMFQKLAAKDSDNTEWQQGLGVSHNRLGTALEAQGDLTGAFQAYRIYNEIFQKLAIKDPGNNDWQRELAVSHNRLGSVFEAQGDVTIALQAFRTGTKIFEKLSAKDPDNTGWQRDLAFTHRRIGEVLIKLKDLPAALLNYRTALECMTPLTSRPGGPVFWRWDMARIHNGLGQALGLSGEPDAALREFQEAEREAQSAAEASPEDVFLQGGPALVSLRLGQILLSLNPPQTEHGLAKLKEGRDRLLRLKQKPGLDFYQEQWLAELEQEIAKAKRR